MSNKKRKCKECNEFVIASEGVKFPIGFFCTYEHAMWFAEAKTSKAKLIAAKKLTKEKAKTASDQKRKFKLSDVSHQHKLTQMSFNRMRVKEELIWFKDKGIEPYCISCGKTKMDWCCGHFKTVGSSGSLRYDRNNSFLQCNWYCNMNKSGNIEGCKNTHGYKKGLLMRFGEEGEVIIDYCERNQSNVKKWTGIELKNMRKEFSKVTSGLEKYLN